MAVARDILTKKGSHVWSVGPTATVLDAALLMNDHKVGSLVVLDQGEVVGMFTERDVLMRVVALRRDPADTRIEEVMTTDVVCCTLDTDLEEARGAMKNRRIRHLPVVDGGRKLLGLVSIGDLNAYHSDSQELTIYHLNEYIYGRV